MAYMHNDCTIYYCYTNVVQCRIEPLASIGSANNNVRNTPEVNIQLKKNSLHIFLHLLLHLLLHLTLNLLCTEKEKHIISCCFGPSTVSDVQK